MDTRQDIVPNESTSSMIKRKLAEAKGNPLVKHVDYMGGKRSDQEGISYSSMTTQNEKMGDDWFTARSTAARVSAGVGIKMHGCPFASFEPDEVVGVLNHSHHTGVYNVDGTINEKLLNQLCAYSEKNKDGVEVLTEKRFYEFLTACRKQENSTDWLGEMASNNEWSGYWDRFSQKDENGNRCVKVEQIVDFYVDSAKPGQEVEERVRCGM